MAETGSGRPKEPEFNPRWKGYVYMLVSSLVNFASISNLDIEDNPEFHGMYQVSLVFGITTFTITGLILAIDRFQSCCSLSDDWNYTKCRDGKVEGYTLAAFTFFWIFGVAHITQVDGIAYVATNIYFSSWLTLFSCIYTLDKWSAAKDILSIQELTGLSATLKSWYLLFLGSLVSMGTSCQLHVQLTDEHKSSAAYGVSLGLVSTLVALFFILVHYRLIDFDFLQVGGWIELSASFCMILVWVVGVSILTSEGGIAATIGGSGCTTRTNNEYESIYEDSCYVVWVDPELEEQLQNVDVPEPPPPKQTENPTNPPTQSPQTEEPTISEPQSTAGGESKATPAPSESIIPSLAPSQSESEASNVPTPDISQSESEISSMPTADPSQSESEAPSIQTPAPTAAEEPSAPPSTSPSTGVVDDNINATTGNLTSTLDDDQFLGGDFQSGFDDDGLDGLEINDNVTLFNFTSNVSNVTNTTVVQDDRTRWLQATNSPFNATRTNNVTAVPTASPTIMDPILPHRTNQPTNAPTPDPYVNRIACDDILDRQVPGSNLYLACWICFFASFNITLRWKAAQAIQFAQAQNRKADERAGLTEEDLNASERENDDDDDDVSGTGHGDGDDL